MRRVVLQMGVTLDGYVAGPGWADSRIARGDLTEEIKDLAKPLRVDLAEARSFPDGTVIHVYQPITTTG